MVSFQLHRRAPGRAVRPHPARTVLVGGVAAGALVVGVLAAPLASAAPIDQVHDFSDGPQGWYSYPDTAPSSVVDGEYCVVVPGGSANPWDIAIQHDGLTFEAGTDLTASFRAHATADVSVNLRAGTGWPDDVASTVAVTTVAQDFAFSWEPGFSGDGNVSFQLGGKSADYTLCLDDFSISGAQELVPDTSFDGVLPEGWTNEGWTVTSEPGDGEPLCFEVPGTSGTYSGLVLNGLPIEEGGNYELRYTASASNGATIRTVVGENAAPWRTAFVDSTELSTELTEHVLPFTSGVTFPAQSSDPAVGVGQVALQMGDRGDFTFCITSLSLRKVATPPPAYEPDTRGPVRVNQVGYLTNGPKSATVVSDATDPLAWQLQDADEHVVAEGTATPAGTDPTSQLAVQTIDFREFTTPGEGYTLVVGDDRSDPFAIGADLYDQLRYDALNYYYPVRSGIAVDVPDDTYDRPAGHVDGPDGAVNKGDVDVACLTAADDGASWSYGSWTCPEGYARDVVGGWYDAGDHGKYVVNGGISVAQLMSLYERSLHTDHATDGALADGTLDVPADESGNGVPDVLDESRWELEFFLAMQVPQGSGMTVSADDDRSLDGLVHHKIHDVGWTGLGLLPSADPQQRRLHRPSTAATLNVAATAAQGARLFREYDADFADRLLEAAQTAYAAAQRVPDLYAPASAGSNGGGPYDDTDVSDEMYWAAAELYLTTGDDEYEADVLASEHSDDDIWSRSGFSWGSVAALGRLDLATVPSDLPTRDEVRASVVEGAEKYLGWQEAEAFGTAYPGSDDGQYEWGSSSSVLNNQVVLATAYDLTDDPRFSDAVAESMDYLLGRNALNNSYVTGYGTQYSTHQHSRWLVPPMPGTVSGGPNSRRGTWDPVMNTLYPAGHECAPQACYVDDIEAWSVNELTINWNAPLSWVASFLADLGEGVAPQAPAFTQQPHGVTVALGATATFTVQVTGTPTPTVAWQWRTGAGTWQTIPRATGTTLSVVASAATDGRQYRAVLTSTAGTATSSVATLVVKAQRPVVTKHPTSASAAVGRSVTLRASASGYPTPTVRWQLRKPGSSSWKNVAGGTRTWLTVRLSTANTGTQYRAVFTNRGGSATSRAATVRLAQAAPRFTSHPASTTVRAGQKATFTVTVAAYPKATLTWYVRTKGSASWKAVTGARWSTLSVTATRALDGAQYRAVARSSAGSAWSKVATLTVR
ncbi:glycoside hydrolase family 9 protein [Cellulomonas sp. DKR-3]|uniref:Endoglucanase n=1 Tax=Cellulomonas fulva TaxID=2835530 RepID=A0ABS5U2Z7_9CELL|nr:glycoside hydrolase family 9 protein [Cellulomonas fulva]MBT0995751.1 glycoside hydrolase family 9 protein [Cellulomonas fulva]